MTDGEQLDDIMRTCDLAGIGDSGQSAWRRVQELANNFGKQFKRADNAESDVRELKAMLSKDLIASARESFRKNSVKLTPEGFAAWMQCENSKEWEYLLAKCRSFEEGYPLPEKGQAMRRDDIASMVRMLKQNITRADLMMKELQGSLKDLQQSCPHNWHLTHCSDCQAPRPDVEAKR